MSDWELILDWLYDTWLVYEEYPAETSLHLVP